jgi:chromosome segregation ATPase
MFERRLLTLMEQETELRRRIDDSQAQGFGDEHPVVKTLVKRYKEIEVDRARARKSLAISKKEVEDKVHALTERILAVRKMYLTQAAGTTSLSQDSEPKRQSASENKSLQAKLTAALGDIAKLQSEINALRAQGAAHRANLTTGETSLPILKHRLRLAEAEPPMLAVALQLFREQHDLLRHLSTKGAASESEVLASAVKITEAQAKLDRAQVEIASLRALIAELEKSVAAPAETAPAKPKTPQGR